MGVTVLPEIVEMASDTAIEWGRSTDGGHLNGIIINMAHCAGWRGLRTTPHYVVHDFTAPVAPAGYAPALVTGGSSRTQEARLFPSHDVDAIGFSFSYWSDWDGGGSNQPTLQFQLIRTSTGAVIDAGFTLDQDELGNTPGIADFGNQHEDAPGNSEIMGLWRDKSIGQVPPNQQLRIDTTTPNARPLLPLKNTDTIFRAIMTNIMITSLTTFELYKAEM